MSDDRTSYIGGPGAAAVLGINPYQTPVALWMQLTRRAPPIEVNDAMRAGQRLEPVVLAYAGEELGAPILPARFIRDPREPFGGHLDGEVEREGRLAVVEAKTARGRAAWGDPGTDQVPPHIACQVLWYLGLTEARVAYVPVLFSGLEFALYTVPRDDAVIGEMREACARFWRDYVVADVPPPPQSGTDALALFPRDTGKVVLADDAVARAVTELRAARANLKQFEALEEELESRIKVAMGDAATLTIGGEIAATWKSSTSKRFDSAAFKAAQPETHQQFCREQTSRRFLLK